MASSKMALARQREMEAWRLRAQGMTTTEIAERLGVRQNSVSKMLKRVLERSLREMPDKVAEVLFQQKEALEYLLFEAITEWNKSRQPLRRVKRYERQELVGDGDKQKVVTLVTEEKETEDRLGDVRYLEQAREILEDIRELFGLRVGDTTVQQFFYSANGMMQVNNNAAEPADTTNGLAEALAILEEAGAIAPGSMEAIAGQADEVHSA